MRDDLLVQSLKDSVGLRFLSGVAEKIRQGGGDDEGNIRTSRKA